MLVEVFTRHSESCPHKNNRYYRKCKCRKWLILVDQNKRITAKTRSWEQAEKYARELSEGKAEAIPDGQSVRHAVTAFLDDKKQQSLSGNWTRKLERELLDFLAYCDTKVLLRLVDIRLADLEKYRATWNGSAVTRRKRQERLRQFFLYCIRHEWIGRNRAQDLSSIKVTTPPTLPLTSEQFEAVLEAVKHYNPKASDGAWRRQRAEAIILLLRWSGLRIGDAARLERTALTESGSLRLYTQKTGEAVYVPLPPHAVKLLRKLPNDNPAYFFWNGTSAKDSPGKRWWSTLKKIFKAAGIPDAHPHMLRDTFAVEMLLAGVPIDQVSILLGHSSVKITEKHYSPWVLARQRQLEQSVRKAWTA
jgi:integrase